MPSEPTSEGVVLNGDDENSDDPSAVSGGARGRREVEQFTVRVRVPLEDGGGARCSTSASALLLGAVDDGDAGGGRSCKGGHEPL